MLVQPWLWGTPLTAFLPIALSPLFSNYKRSCGYWWRPKRNENELNLKTENSNKIFVILSKFMSIYSVRTLTWDVISLNTRRVSASQFLCWATLAEIWPAIFVLSPSFQPRTFTCRTLNVFSGPFNSILMMWLSPPGSSLVTQPICLESKSTWLSRNRTGTWYSRITLSLPGA